MKRKAGIDADHGGQSNRRSMRNGAGQGGATEQLQRAGNAVTQASQKRPRHAVPPGAPVNKMAPVPPKKRTRTSVSSKKPGPEATVSESSCTSAIDSQSYRRSHRSSIAQSFMLVKVPHDSDSRKVRLRTSIGHLCPEGELYH